MMKKYRNPLARPENFLNPTGNVMKELKEADLNSFSAGAGEPRVSWFPVLYINQRMQLGNNYVCLLLILSDLFYVDRYANN